MNNIKSFTFYREYYELITLLPAQEQAELLLKILEYVFEDKEIDNLTNSQQKIWNNLIKPIYKSKIKSHQGSVKYIDKVDNETDNETDNESTNTSNDVNVNVICINNNKLNNKEEKIKKEETTLKRFNEFWETYPRHTNKAKTKEWYLKNKPNEETHKSIIIAVKLQSLTKEWEDTKFIPYPTTYLNQKRWEDYENE